MATLFKKLSTIVYTFSSPYVLHKVLLMRTSVNKKDNLMKLSGLMKLMYSYILIIFSKFQT